MTSYEYCLSLLLARARPKIRFALIEYVLNFLVTFLLLTTDRALYTTLVRNMSFELSSLRCYQFRNCNAQKLLIMNSQK